MKKIYSLLFVAVTTLSFGQVITDSFNYADNSLLTDNGWALTGTSVVEPIDVGASNGLVYAGYNATAGNAARLDNNGQDVNKAFAAPVTSGNLYYSFLVKVTAASDGYFAHLITGTTIFFSKVFVRPSTTANKINFGVANSNTATWAPTDFDLDTTYLIILKYEVSATGPVSLWVKSSGVPATEAAAGTPDATASGSGSATVAGVALRQFNAGQNITVDEIKVYNTWFGATPCALSLNPETTACNAFTLNLDTYTTTIPFVGGGTTSYTLSANAGTIGGDSPSTNATGNIVISNIPEGTNVTLTVGGACAFTKTVISPECKPTLGLPYYEPFAYAEASSLGASQQWTNVNTGDNIIVAGGTLTPAYPGLSPSTTGYAIFDGAGIDCSTTFTSTTTGTVYYSFILNVNTMAGVTEVNGGYFATLGSSANSFGATLWTKRVDDGIYNLGIETRTDATGTTFDTTALATGTTYFVVVGYTLGDPTIASDDTVSLWINPTINAAQPTATITDSHAGTDLAAISNFILRQDSITETPSMSIDELRIGTTWAQVTNGTLATNQNTIAGLKMYPNPVSNGTLFIETAANAEKTIAVYDVLGKIVLNTTTSESAVNVSSLHTGVYIVNITEEGKTASRKLVIK